MKETNTGKSFNWKHTVEQLNQLPGEPAFDKHAAWEKLQNRLYKKKNAKKIICYRLAAACLLAGLIAGVAFFNKQEPDMAVVDGQQKQTKKVIQEQLIIQNKKKNNRINGLVTDKNITINVAAKKDKKRIAAIDSIVDISKVEFTNLNQPKVPVAELVIVQPLKVDTAATFAVRASVIKKKLKVVHINELGLPIGTEPSVAQNHQLLFLQSNYSNNRNLVSNLNTEGYSSPAFFSIKLNSPK